MQNAGVDYFQRRQAWRNGMGLRLRLLDRWAQSHALLGPANADRLAAILKRLDTETLSIAFVGEISRGKSELINAIFFGTHPHRVLPVGPGRTTLCPTEIRFQSQSGSSLQLLPIETAEDPRPLTEWQNEPEAWTHVSLAHNDFQRVAEDLQRITLTQEQEVVATRSTPANQHAAHLPHAGLPRWRYATVNLPHPLLAHGLRIFDMPGLNAVAAEPQLSLGLLAQCDVLVFLLSADTGVTASELALWQEHMVQGAGAGCQRLVVLNKVDALWNSVQDTAAVEQQLQEMQMDVAAALGVAQESVVSVSAREAVAAQGTGDAARLARSGLSQLEHALWKTLLLEHHQRCQADIAKELASCKAEVERALRARAQALEQSKERLLKQTQLSTDIPHNAAGSGVGIDTNLGKELPKIQATKSILMDLLEKIRRTLPMPELDATIAALELRLRQSMGLTSVRHAYDQAHREIQAQWLCVDQWAGEMRHMLSAAEQEGAVESANPHQPPAPLHFAPYLDLLQQAFNGHVQFLGNSQVHRLKQAGFTGKLVTALRTRITEIGQQLQQDFEGWFARASETIRHRLESSRGATLQEHQQTRDYLLSQLQTQEDKFNQLNQTLDAYFSALLEANGYD